MEKYQLEKEIFGLYQAQKFRNEHRSTGSLSRLIQAEMKGSVKGPPGITDGWFPWNLTMQALRLPSSVFSCFTAPEKLHISSSVPGSCLTFTWSDLKLRLFFSVLPDDPQLTKTTNKGHICLTASCTFTWNNYMQSSLSYMKCSLK